MVTSQDSLKSKRVDNQTLYAASRGIRHDLPGTGKLPPPTAEPLTREERRRLIKFIAQTLILTKRCGAPPPGHIARRWQSFWRGTGPSAFPAKRSPRPLNYFMRETKQKYTDET